MRTILDLRRQIEQVLSGRLGTYKMTDGTTTSAVWVGGRVSDKVSSVSGLEVIIEPTPDITETPLFARQKAVKTVFKVRLVEHRPNRPMTSEMLLMEQAFFMDRSPSLQPESDLVLQQATFYIREDSLLK